MAIAKVVTSINSFFETTLGRSGRVIEVKTVDDGWNSIFETIEEMEYMRKIAQDDMVAVYDVQVDKNYEIVGYSRKSIRSRKESV
jgi:hypothetical protein